MYIPVRHEYFPLWNQVGHARLGGEVPMIYVQVLSFTLLGAFLQANIGFGFSVIAMVFLPMLFPFSTAITLNKIIALASTGFLTFKYLRYIQWRTLLPFLAMSMAVIFAVTLYSFTLASRTLMLALGAGLILLALYLFFLNNKVAIKANLGNALLMGTVAGLSSGLLGISGPPVSLYLFASVKEKRAYLSTIQAFFFISNIESIIIRAWHGDLQITHWPVIASGWVGVGVGTWLGLLLFKRIKDTTLRSLVYIFVGLSGLWIVIQQI